MMMAQSRASFNRLAPELVLEIINQITTLESLHCLFQAVPYAGQVFRRSPLAPIILDNILDNYVPEQIAYLIRLIALLRSDTFPMTSLENFRKNFIWPSCKKIAHGSTVPHPHKFMWEDHEDRLNVFLPKSLPSNIAPGVIFDILHVAYRISCYTPECLQFYLERFKKIQPQILVVDNQASNLVRASAPKAPHPRGRGRSAVLSWRLEERNVLVVGGGQVAADRIADALQAGAKVTVMCSSTMLDPELAERIVAEQIKHIDRGFEPSDLDETDMIIVAIEDLELCERIWKLAREKVPVNIININSQDLEEKLSSSRLGWYNIGPRFPPSFFGALEVDFQYFIEVWWPPIPPWERGPRETWNWALHPAASDHTGPVTWVEIYRVARSFWKLELFLNLKLAVSQSRLKWSIRNNQRLQNMNAADFFYYVYGFNNDHVYHIQSVVSYLDEEYIKDDSALDMSKLVSLCRLPASSSPMQEIIIPPAISVLEEHDIYNYDYISFFSGPHFIDEPLFPEFPKESFLPLGLPLWQRWRLEAAGFDWDRNTSWDTWFCHLGEGDRKKVLNGIPDYRTTNRRSIWHAYYHHYHILARNGGK